MDATTNTPPAKVNTRITANGSTPAAALPIGTRLLEFELTAFLGEGGFSIVYAAQDLRLHRVVAIKEYMPTAFSSRNANCEVEIRSQRHRLVFDAGMHSFIDEARLLARFKHPALVDVLRFWEGNGTAYMAMPLYEGQTLRQTLNECRGNYDEDWLCGMIAPILDVLEMLHAESVYHRDVAPDNIIIQRNGLPVLLDLGSARRVLGDSEHSPTVIVKPGYTPIEQYAETSSIPQGPWTDIYALGALLHFAVTGTPPLASVSRVIKDLLQPLSGQGITGYSDRFLKTIDRALALQPKDRPQSISELRAMLGIDKQVRPLPLPSLSAAAPLTPRKNKGSEEPKTLILTVEELRDLNERPNNAVEPPAPTSAVSLCAAAPEPAIPATSSKGAPSALDSLISSSSKSGIGSISVPAPPREAPSTSASSAPSAESSVRFNSKMAVGMTVCMLLLAGALILWKPWHTQSAIQSPIGSVASSDPDHPPSTRSPSLEQELPSPTQTNTSTNSPHADGPANSAALMSPQEIRPNPAEVARPTIQTEMTDNSPQSSQSSEADVSWQTQAHAQAERPVSLPPTPSVVTIKAPPHEPAEGSSARAAHPERENPAVARAQTAPVIAPTPKAAARPENRSNSQAATSTQILTVAVKPWGEVWIDGNRRGISPPVLKLPLRPGSYQVELRNPGFPVYRQRIEILPGHPVTLRYNFQ